MSLSRIGCAVIGSEPFGRPVSQSCSWTSVDGTQRRGRNTGRTRADVRGDWRAHGPALGPAEMLAAIRMAR